MDIVLNISFIVDKIFKYSPFISPQTKIFVRNIFV